MLEDAGCSHYCSCCRSSDNRGGTSSVLLASAQTLKSLPRMIAYGGAASQLSKDLLKTQILHPHIHPVESFFEKYLNEYFAQYKFLKL